jgi:hypothetical protein
MVNLKVPHSTLIPSSGGATVILFHLNDPGWVSLFTLMLITTCTGYHAHPLLGRGHCNTPPPKRPGVGLLIHLDVDHHLHWISRSSPPSESLSRKAGGYRNTPPPKRPGVDLLIHLDVDHHLSYFVKLNMT